jgi:ATP-binding cassette subfamily F protein 3
LLRATTDEFLIVANGRLQEFDGDLDDYRDWLFKTRLSPQAAALPTTADKAAAPAAPAVDRREQKRLEAEERQRLSSQRKPIESRIKRLEEQMAKQQARKSEIDAQLADQAIYEAERKEELKALITEQAYCARELEQLESEWLQQQEALEQLV